MLYLDNNSLSNLVDKSVINWLSSALSLDELLITRLNDTILVAVRARSFLYRQVRNIVGALAFVGQGRWSEDDLVTALEARDRSASGPTAPAEGLFLVSVHY